MRTDRVRDWLARGARRSLGFGLCLLLAGCAQVRATNSSAEGGIDSQTIEVSGMQVTTWLPRDLKGEPVVLFSHGFHGCATQSRFLMEALAQAGYAVFAPNHRDATCNSGASSWAAPASVPFKKVDQWTDKTYTDRGADLKKLLDALPSDPRFSGLDWERVGLAGHSLGGYTVLALAGGWPSWKDHRIKAALALSPYSYPFIERGTLGNIDVPVMYQGGTRDFGITPSVQKNRGAYDQTRSSKYFVDLDGAGHFAWTDLRKTYHRVIDVYSVAFFDTVLKGKNFPESLRQKARGVFKVRIEERPANRDMVRKQ